MNMNNSNFHSETFGELNISQVREKIAGFMEEDSKSRYRVVIGSDSQPKNSSSLDFITAIVIHRVGRGGIYFWKRKVKHKNYHKFSHSLLRQRIYEEAALSLETAEDFLKVFKYNGISKLDVEIHVDIGNAGETRDMISEVVGMIRGSGFVCKTKPESFGASKVADRHT